jgi:tRNA(fMet)-specific endonuclease VapC
MSQMFLLDTNACIQIMTGRSSAIVTRLADHHPGDVRLCSVVRGELVYGAYHSARPAENLRAAERFAAPFESLPFDDNCSEICGRIRSGLVARGTPIGPNDMMIAAIAIWNKLTLVTANVGEFGHVPGLSIENWEN